MCPTRRTATAGRVLAVQANRRRMHDDRGELRVAVDLQSEQEHRCLCGDEHLDVVGQVETVGSLPPGAVEEVGHQQLHAFELAGRQQFPVLELAARAAAARPRRTRVACVRRDNQLADRCDHEVGVRVRSSGSSTHGGRDCVGSTEVLGQAPFGVVAEEDLGNVEQSGRVADVVVVDDEFDLRASPHEVLEPRHHLRTRRRVQLHAEVVGRTHHVVGHRRVFADRLEHAEGPAARTVARVGR